MENSKENPQVINQSNTDVENSAFTLLKNLKETDEKEHWCCSQSGLNFNKQDPQHYVLVGAQKK